MHPPEGWDGTDEGAGRPARRAPRWQVHGELPGEVSARFEVAVVDVSILGACVEHTQQMQPGQTYFLHLVLGDQPVRLQARAVWSTVYRSEKTGGKRLFYRTGVEFIAPSPAALEALRGLLARESSPDPGEGIP